MTNRGAPAKIWIDVLRRITPILTESHVTDMILFGSQAMSAYMERALASEDIDLIAPGIRPNTLEKTRDELKQIAAQTPTYDHLVSEYAGRPYPVSHIYLKHMSGYPFVIEFFENFLGYESTRLNSFLTLKNKWGLELQVLLPEAIIATRLAFRPPERVSRFNASRLNRFIKHIRHVDWKIVNAFIDAFELRTVVAENLAELRAKRISINGTSKIISSS
jgi:predicted nucleotidyltransferase